MKLKKVLIILTLTLMPWTVWADMTDAQIIQYVTEQSAKGTSQSQMLQYLMSQGVTPQRLQQIREKYKNTSAGGKGGSTRTTADRSRSNNGVATKGSTHGRLLGTSGKDGKFDETSPDYLAMQDALTGLTPDSTNQTMYPLEPQGPRIFGHEMFNNENINFEPNMNIATPANYVLGAGDLIYIDIYGASQLTIEGTISPDGFIVINEYGPLQLAGLTVEEANRRARTKLSSCYADSKIQLTVGQTRTIQINVMGEVKVPGTYTMSAFATVFHALYAAGGVNEIGSLRDVKLYRNNELKANVDIYEYILNGQLSGDIRLQDNDVLVIAPYSVLVNVAGKARRPMYYEMKPSETIAQAIQYAGGMASDAYTKSMRLVRKGGSKMQVFNIDANNMQSFTVADGDSLYIDSLLMRYENMVELKGAVFRPGMYQLNEQTSSVKSLVEYADGTTETAFLNRAVLQRRRADRTLEVMSLDLRGILKGSVADVELRNEDVLFVPDQKDNQEGQTLTIRGEVYEPGIYQFAHNTSIEDLVLQAGGLKESASTEKVSVARRQKNGGIQTYEVDLQKDFALNGKSNFVLEPYDEVLVKRLNGYTEKQTVRIEGEVNFQGEFSLSKQDTRISELLQMAGGLTESAAQNGVYVLRKMNDEELRIRRNRLDEKRYQNSYSTTIRSSQMQGVTKLPISDSLLVERDLREDIYKVAVDIRQALKKPGSDKDLVLRDGDCIVVEKQKNTVTLTGSIPYQSTVPYVEGKTLKYYLRQGGIRPTRRNLKMSYAIAQNGQATSYRRWHKIEPGTEIYLRETTSEMTTTQRITIFSSVASTFATAAAVVIAVLK